MKEKSSKAGPCCKTGVATEPVPITDAAPVTSAATGPKLIRKLCCKTSPCSVLHQAVMFLLHNFLCFVPAKGTLRFCGLQFWDLDILSGFNGAEVTA